MVGSVSIGFVALSTLFVWRLYSLLKHNRIQSSPPHSLITKYLLPFAVLAIIGVITALFTIPFASPEAAPQGFPLRLRQLYILISHFAYAATGASTIFLVLTRREGSSLLHGVWTLITIFVALTLQFLTTLVSARYGQIVFGSAFIGDLQHITRILFFGTTGLSFLFTIWRTNRANAAPRDISYWIEPLLLATGMILRGIGAIAGLNVDTLPWL